MDFNQKIEELINYFKEISPCYESLKDFTREEIMTLYEIYENHQAKILVNMNWSVKFFILVGNLFSFRKSRSAKIYYKIAIDKGDTDAIFHLASHYEIIEKNYNLAKKYYLLSIEKGNVDAMNNIAVYYEDVETNYEKAKEYYHMAAAKGCVDAMNNLGIFYEEKENNYELAIECYHRAIQLGDTIAYGNLAALYEKKEEFGLAEIYYNLAIDTGDVTSMYNFAHYHSYKTKDYEQMKKYYLMAIDKGDVLSMRNLAEYYDKIEKNNEMALKYQEMYKKSCDENLIDNQ